MASTASPWSPSRRVVYSVVSSARTDSTAELSAAALSNAELTSLSMVSVGSVTSMELVSSSSGKAAALIS